MARGALPVAALAPASLRGTAFGVFNLLGGVALLAASAIAGGLWDAYGSQVTFFFGATLSALALLGLLLVRARRTQQ